MVLDCSLNLDVILRKHAAARHAPYCSFHIIALRFWTELCWMFAVSIKRLDAQNGRAWCNVDMAFFVKKAKASRPRAKREGAVI